MTEVHTHILISSHQNVVGFNVSMKNTATLHQLQSQEQLLCVRADGLDVKTDVFTVLLEDFS